MQEKQIRALPGIPIFVLLLLFVPLLIWSGVQAIMALDAMGFSGNRLAWLIGTILTLALDALLMAGVFTVHPNEAKVLQLFGRYVGTVANRGLRWGNPFYTKHKVSLRVRNFETGKLKINDKRGNPVEIACVVVWKVVDTAEAVFMVDDYTNYVHVQSEAAVRNMVTGFVYDVYESGEKALVTHTTEISERLTVEIQERLEKAGVQIIESRISHLAYSPEIAGAMLQRQQASAVVAARRFIVDGAVGMVEHALDMMADRKIVELDTERRAAMVSNLLVVLCSDRHTQPVVNTGSLYN
jgi:regulator of protease activity HflC (stomatin/prohibitin superfamily)